MLTEFLQQIINGLTIGTIYSLMACGLTLIFGVMLVVNFAHGEFYMLGGFLVYQMVAILRINYAISLIMSVVIIILFGMIVERLLLKPMRGEGIINTAVVMIGLLNLFAKYGIINLGSDSQKDCITFLKRSP